MCSVGEPRATTRYSLFVDLALPLSNRYVRGHEQEHGMHATCNRREGASERLLRLLSRHDFSVVSAKAARPWTGMELMRMTYPQPRRRVLSRKSYVTWCAHAATGKDYLALHCARTRPAHTCRPPATIADTLRRDGVRRKARKDADMSARPSCR